MLQGNSTVVNPFQKKIEVRKVSDLKMSPEEKARVIIDKQLTNAGWDIVSRDEYVPRSASAVK